MPLTEICFCGIIECGAGNAHGGEMSELKPCPFCGLEAQTYSDGNYTVVYCNCINCDPIDWDGVNPEIWNTRPIEDALRAELERRTAELHYANTACMEMKRELDRLNAEIKTGRIKNRAAVSERRHRAT